MIGYLEQLERDLVAAIDRREQPRSAWRAWRPHWPLPRLELAAVAAIAVVAFALAMVALLRPAGHERTVVQAPATEHAPPRQTGIGPRTPLRLVATVTRADATTWHGQARGPGGTGVLTFLGSVRLVPSACCSTPLTHPAAARAILRFEWTTDQGTLTGCVDNTIYRRPHGRWVWDGSGRVMHATGALRRYGGRAIGIAGETTTSATDEARIILSAAGPDRTARC